MKMIKNQILDGMTIKTDYFKLGIVFDMDGVIIDSNPFHKIAWTNFFNKRNVDVNDAIFRDLIFGTSGGEAICTLLNMQFSRVELNEFCNEIDSEYRDILRKSKNIQPVNGLIRFLNSLREGNHKIAMATSAPAENVELVMNKLNILKYFDLIIDKTQVNKGKPDPEIYLKAINRLCIPAEHCIVFEDSISGIFSAREAGIKVIGVTTSHSEIELIEAGATLTIADFTEISVPDIVQIMGNSLEQT